MAALGYRYRLMKIEKGDSCVRFDDWEMSIHTDYPERLLWVHIHSHSQVYGDAYACFGEPMACRNCGLEIPTGILMLGLLQRKRIERGE